MAYMRPDELPPDRGHLDDIDRRSLAVCDALVQHDLAATHDLLETLWWEAIDAHRLLYQGLANVLAAVIAHSAGQRSGAVEIARRAHTLLAPFPDQAVGFDLQRLLRTMDAALSGATTAVCWDVVPRER